MVATPQCSNCFYSFVAPASASTTNNPADRPFAGKRFCNRQAPMPPNPLVGSGWLWPLVADDWWCGEGADSSTGQAYANTINSVPGTGGAGPGYLATSTTSLTIAASGSLAATTQLNLAYTPGARVRLTSAGTAAWMEGVVTAYSAAGVLTFTADTASGSGAHTDWNINLAGQPGTNGTNGLGVASWGQFGTTATRPIVVSDGNIQANSRVVVTPANQTGAQFVVAHGAFVTSVTAGVGFSLDSGDLTSFAGTEQFAYIVSTT